jgi:hypothetical protein
MTDDKWHSIYNFGFQSLDNFIETNLRTERLNMSFRDLEEKDEPKFDDDETNLSQTKTQGEEATSNWFQLSRQTFSKLGERRASGGCNWL